MVYIQEYDAFFNAHNAREAKKLLSMMTLEEALAYDRYVKRQSLRIITGRSASTDSQRNKTYQAEFDFEKIHKPRKFNSFEEANRYLQKVKRSKTWEKLNGRKDVRLIMKRDMGGLSASAGRAHPDGRIDLCPTWGMNEYVLLHEMAHQCGHMHHDVSFRQCLVKLVSRFMGAEQGRCLKKCFKDRKLKMTLNTSIKSPIVWLESYRRMETVRKARR